LLGRAARSAIAIIALPILSLALASPAALADTSHTVRKGDTLYKISQQYGVTVSSIKSANGLWSDEIYPGQTLTIKTTNGSSSSGSYTVQSGDTLFLIAQRHGVSVAQLKAVNGLTSDMIRVGQKLTIPSGGKATSPGGQSSSYTVRSGDSLYKIANAHGVTVASLKQANGLTTDNIFVGQVLTIPSGASSGGSGKTSVSASDRDLLARLVHAEASGEVYEGKVAVAATVLNRVASPAYPNSIPAIIYQVLEGRYYQYEPVLNGTINRPAGSEAFKATDAALSGWDPSYGAIGFYNPAKTSNAWVRSRPVTVKIGNHVFFK
jgi:N-acetylmuramoyl-L-alanine amidase